MAMWREVVPHQPPRLLTFRPQDWLPATGHTAWQRWSDARFEYLLAHPGQHLNGADIIDVIFETP